MNALRTNGQAENILPPLASRRYNKQTNIHVQTKTITSPAVAGAGLGHPDDKQKCHNTMANTARSVIPYYPVNEALTASAACKMSTQLRDSTANMYICNMSEFCPSSSLYRLTGGPEQLHMS